jgi:hypothetical protein
MGLVVAAAVFWVAYLILHPGYRHALGVVALVMSLSYATLGVLVRIRLAEDRKAVFAFLSFAMTFLTIAGPLHFRLNGITVAWSAEAVLLVWLGFKYRYLPVRLGGLVVLGLAVGRLFVRHWPLHDGAYDLLATRSFAVAAFVSAAVAAFAIVHAAFRVRAIDPDHVVRRITGIAAGLLPLFVLNHEIGDWLGLAKGADPAWVFRTTGGAVYGVGALLFFLFGRLRRSVTARLAALAVLDVAALVLFSTYPGGLPFGVEPFANARFPIAFALGVLTVAIGVDLSGRRADVEPLEKKLGDLLTLGGAGALVAVIAVDLWHLLIRSSTYAALVGTSALFVVSAAAFLLLAFRIRRVSWRVVSFLLLLLATGTGLASHLAVRPADSTWFLNARFLVSLLVSFSWIWQGEWARGRRGILREVTGHDGAILGWLGATLLLLTLSADLGGRLHETGTDEALAGIALLWAIGTLAWLLVGRRADEVLWRGGSLLFLCIAAVPAFMLYAANASLDRTFFLSLPWGTALLVSLAGFAWGTIEREEPRLGESIRLLAALALLAVTSFELFSCLDLRSGTYAAYASVTALNAVAATGFALFGARLPSRGWRLTALLPLLAGGLLCLELFGPGMEREFVLFLNGRFAALLSVAAATFGVGRLALTDERRLGVFLGWLSAGLLLFVLSAEAWLYAQQEAAGPEQARFATQMALSVTWSVYAVAILVLGFRLRLRPLRLTALGLFAITVAKLVFVDLAAIEQEQIFRILSFFVAGVLMIGGSYLYHRVERAMEDR